MLADAPVAGLPGTFLAYEPIGVVLAIMPWNYPLWQVVRFLAPTLAAGNGAILKHAANVPQCALAVERLVAEAGAPAGLLANIFVEPDMVRSEEHTSELQSLMRISYAVFCLKKKKKVYSNIKMISKNKSQNHCLSLCHILLHCK